MKITPRKLNPIILSMLALATILLAGFLFFPDLLIRGTPGSFEYIRKGEVLMDKGKHIEAIKCYEKARDSSPDNEEIKNSLIYVYSTYASKVASDEMYDIGIEYLSKARDVTSNSYTRQNLALMYAKSASQELKTGEFSRAQTDLEMARQTVGESVSGCRNLGITLYNDSVEEFKAGREENAIILAKEASLSYADSRVFEFLADIYYKKTDLRNTRFYIEKAASLDPKNIVLADRVARVIKEEALSASEKTESLPSFDLKYDANLSVKSELMASILNKAYYDVGRDLDYFPKGRITVFFYSEKDFREIFKMRDIVRAFYDGNIRIPLPNSMSDEKELASYLCHEYAHAIVSAKSGNNCPVWLSEGIAVYEEMKWTRPGTIINIGPEVLAGNEVSISAVNAAFSDPEVDAIRLTLYYILADTAVQFIVDNWGLKGLNTVLVATSSGKHAVNAMDDEFLLSEVEFNRKWSDFVINKYVKKGEGS